MIRRLALAAVLTTAATTLATGVAGTTTPAAHAAAPTGHLVFAKGGDVWVANPDGSGQVRVTTDGGYSEPSMSDNGRIAAVNDHSVVVLRPDGSRLASFELPTLFVEGSCGTLWETPPLEAQISPDGTKIAWSQLRASSCDGRITIDSRTAITDATTFKLHGLVLGYDPDWVGNGKVVLDDNDTMALMKVDHSGPKADAWFSSYDLWGTYYDFHSVAVSRDGSRVAYLVDRYDDPELVVDHPTTGDPRTSDNPGIPSDSGVCQAQSDLPRPQDGPVLDDLMFSPDGTAMAHIEGDSVWVIGGVGGPCESRTFTKVLTGVDDVSWSGYTGTVAIDRTAPTVRIGGVGVKKRTATVRFSGADDTTPAGELSFRCQVDAAAKRACTSPQAFTRLKPGKHTVKVWAIDAAGNTSAAAGARFTVRS